MLHGEIFYLGTSPCSVRTLLILRGICTRGSIHTGRGVSALHAQPSVGQRALVHCLIWCLCDDFWVRKSVPSWCFDAACEEPCTLPQPFIWGSHIFIWGAY